MSGSLPSRKGPVSDSNTYRDPVLGHLGSDILALQFKGCCPSHLRIFLATSGVEQRRRYSIFIILLAVFCLSCYYNTILSSFIVKNSLS